RPQGVRALAAVPAPRVPRLLTALERTVRRRGDEPALFAADTTLTWRELARRAGGVARRLAAEGLAPGDRVALRRRAPRRADGGGNGLPAQPDAGGGGARPHPRRSAAAHRPGRGGRRDS